VRVGPLEHLRVQTRQHAREHARGEPLEVAHAHAGDHLADAPAHVVGAFVGRATQAKAQVLEHVARQAATGDHAALEGRAREVDPGGPRHQGLVKIEERRSARLAVR
jgi:hypothetical protein